MLDGPTLDDDEQCILDLLELSDAGDLRAIFADAADADRCRSTDNLHGDNRNRLDAFVASRFQGGRTELLAGRVEVLGDPVPAGAPSYGFVGGHLRRPARQRPDAGRADRDRRPVLT